MSPDGTTGGLTRRRFIAAGGAGAAVLAAGGVFAAVRSGGDGGPAADLVLRASRDKVALGDRTVETMVFDGRLPGREIRLRQGRPTRIRVANDLDVPTTVHWHGIRLENRADGVPDMTQAPIAAGEEFDYVFTPPDAGTYIYHSHFGTQLDRGLYGALIVEPARETLDYDREATLLLDDWLDGIAGDPDAKLEELKSEGMDMGGMDMGDMTAPSSPIATKRAGGPHRRLDGGVPGTDHLAGLANAMLAGATDPGDVRHPLYLVNGRPPEDPDVVDVARGDRLRLRIVNPAADTIFRFFVEDHEMTITHADGIEVRPVVTDGLVVGMGERYDVLVAARAGGSARIVAEPLGKPGRAVALLRYSGSRTQPPGAQAAVAAPRRIASYLDLEPASELPAAAVAREVALPLGLRAPYTWTIAGQAAPEADTLAIRRGETIRFRMANRTNMPHPMHLHGHSFRPVVAGRAVGPLKDTILAAPRRTTTVEWLADNPGAWAFHCHNAYHAEAGMLRRVDVT